MITIDKKSDCSGCEACASACPVGCITFEADGEGFLYPIVDVSRCIGCGACNDVCPVESPRHPIAPRATFGVVNPNRAVRRLSSSGGLFYLLAEGVIERGGVVFGAAFDEAGMVVHRGVESREGLDALRGSKYSQSHIGSAYAEALQALADGRELLFSGTPCQVSGFLHLVPQEYRDRVLAVDIVCHGVPSPAVWRARLNEITGGGKPLKINFRDKRSGWAKYGLAVEYRRSDGVATESYTPKDKESFYRGFVEDLYCRPSCAECPSKSFSSGADLTLGDLWGYEKQHPEDGVGEVFVGSERGAKALESAGAEMFRVEYSEVVAHNPSIERSNPAHPNREKFFSAFLSIGDNGKGCSALIEKNVQKPFTELVIGFVKRKFGKK